MEHLESQEMLGKTWGPWTILEGPYPLAKDKISSEFNSPFFRCICSRGHKQDIGWFYLKHWQIGLHCHGCGR